MADSIVYLNGEYLPEAAALVLVTERGFFGGDGVYEVTGTFAGKLFRLDEHLARLYRSLAYIQVDPGFDAAGMRAITIETLARNLARLDTRAPILPFGIWWRAAMRCTAISKASRGRRSFPSSAWRTISAVTRTRICKECAWLHRACAGRRPTASTPKPKS